MPVTVPRTWNTPVKKQTKILVLGNYTTAGWKETQNMLKQITKYVKKKKSATTIVKLE